LVRRRILFRFLWLSTMADSAKIRLVLCPKCENLLPELADYPVYQCGGCGTVLGGIFFPLNGNVKLFV
jgi:hypothetical protein